MQEHWSDYPMPRMRYEAPYGDRIVRCFNNRPAGFFAMFTASVVTHADHDAVVCDGHRWSYAQTDAEAARIATGLAARGVVGGERVLLFIGNRPVMVHPDKIRRRHRLWSGGRLGRDWSRLLLFFVIGHWFSGKWV